MFLLNNKKINIEMDLVIDGITYPSKSLKNPQFRKSLGIVEVPDSVRMNDEFYFNVENEDGTITSTPKDIVGLREIALLKVKEIRKQSLDQFVASAGISDVYYENVKAVQEIKSGNGKCILRNGKTAVEHVRDFAKAMGVTKEEFLDYIETEVLEKGTKADAVENRYLKVAYSMIPKATFEEIQTIVQDYSKFCDDIIKC